MIKPLYQAPPVKKPKPPALPKTPTNVAKRKAVSTGKKVSVNAVKSAPRRASKRS